MLTSIALANFQSFRERMVLPLAEFNILVGPNSSGKSSIFDALTLAEEILCSSDNGVGINHYLQRWRNSNAGIDERTTIEIELITPNHDNFSLKPIDFRKISLLTQLRADSDALGLDRPNESIFPEDWTGRLTIKITLGPPAAWDAPGYNNQFFEVYVNEKKALEYTAFPGYLKLFPDAFAGRLESVLSIYSYNASEEPLQCRATFTRGRMKEDAIFNPNAQSDLERISILLADYIMTAVTQSLKCPSFVDGNRGAIDDSSVLKFSYFEGSSTRKSNREYITLAPRSSFPEETKASSSCLDILCESAFDEELAVLRADDVHEKKKTHGLVAGINEILEMVVDGHASPGKNPERVHNYVNRHLTESLFLDRGYRISFELCPVLPSRLAANENPGIKYWRNEIGGASRRLRKGQTVFGAILFPHLVDQFGARHTFADVGTGISCVIPVIVALHSYSSFVQQPELHLHPALQTALGDVLIDRLSIGACQHFIETHSEHLILRLLRRIRESSSGRHQVGSSLYLSPENLSIIYFEPTANGSTAAKHIRVSRDGDFIDRWPRGFFDERRKELFDE